MRAQHLPSLHAHQLCQLRHCGTRRRDCRVRRQIFVAKGISIRGAGRDQTTLYMPKSLNVRAAVALR